MEKKNFIILTVVVTLLIFITVCLLGILFWIWYGQTHTGPRSGQVFDTNTGRPIEGAIVKYTWNTSGFMAKAMGGGGTVTSYEIATDKEGKYFIPNLRVKRESILDFVLCQEEVIIYKDGYAVYVADLALIKSPVIKPIGYPNDNQTYSKKNNIIKLYPWKEGESHYRQVDWIRAMTRSSGQNMLLRKELEPETKRADEEMLKKVEEGRKRAEQERAEKRRQTGL